MLLPPAPQITKQGQPSPCAPLHMSFTPLDRQKLLRKAKEPLAPWGSQGAVLGMQPQPCAHLAKPGRDTGCPSSRDKAEVSKARVLIQALSTPSKLYTTKV